MEIPIEDFCEDILGKAMRGTGTSIRELAELSGVTPGGIDRLLAGKFDEEDARTVAPHLGLDPDALAAAGLNAWRPHPVEVDGLAIFNTPWRDMRVNSFLVWDPASKVAAAFDTGADAGGMIEFVETEGLEICAVYITHTHGDHIADLERVIAAFGAPPVLVGEREPIDGASLLPPSHTSQIGALRLETRLTWGHSEGGLTYVIRGLASPIAIVGDAMFAGSMGGGIVSYPDALATNRSEILTLPDDCIICPGHGPMTTVGEEKAHNPFFAKR